MTHTDKLVHTLADARREAQALRPDPSLGPHPGGLSFTRAASLAADPRRWTADEQAHAAGCRLCARLAERIRALVHPGWSALADHAAGRLDGRAARLLTEHTAHCAACARRLAELKSKRDSVLRLEFAQPLAGPMQRQPVELASADRRWQARLSPDAGATRLLFEMRTRDQDLAHRLIGVVLRGEEGRERTCYLLAHQEPDDRRARTAFDLRRLSETLGPQLTALTATALDATQLTPEERSAFLESLPAADAEPRDRAAWCAWLSAASQERGVSDEVRRLLQEAMRRLG